MDTLGINTGGIYDAIGLVESIIIDLDKIEVKGVTNMRIIFDCIGKLGALKGALQKERGETDGNTENR
jgi:hypothetical protein